MIIPHVAKKPLKLYYAKERVSIPEDSRSTHSKFVKRNLIILAIIISIAAKDNFYIVFA